MADQNLHPLHRGLLTLLHELIEGPPGAEAYVLNGGDPGLLASIQKLSAEQASERPSGRSSVAAHVDHVRYGLELFNRWSRGENPWADADWGPSWDRQVVDDREWAGLLDEFGSEARAWLVNASRIEEASELEWTGALASAVHLAYHLGAIRQIAQAASGPPERHK